MRPRRSSAVGASITCTASHTIVQADGAWLLVIALGTILGATVFLTPRRKRVDALEPNPDNVTWDYDIARTSPSETP